MTKKGRGTNTHGGGSGKENRGAGHRGGRGKAGGQKHEKYPQQKWGKQGFKRPQKLTKEKETINIGEIDQIAEHLVEQGKAEQKDQEIKIDVKELGAEKVLGRGKVKNQLKVIAEDFSNSAKEKIREAGGEAEEKNE
ncbi:MAG: Ribosomal protein L15 [Candidatus Methanohalarchaeum thermophilum]|uniref:Large ribosomal subunit protein uL15 n=1 Tax=Methanohalarchaeum thermophilum TaxID=1903181 RepID=A0A1Q6DX45_METT1|nr:MAG: Ribosomal protein L15 [Candidatus Methanohalarchaeum thermophilum]